MKYGYEHSGLCTVRVDSSRGTRGRVMERALCGKKICVQLEGSKTKGMVAPNRGRVSIPDGSADRALCCETRGPCPVTVEAAPMRMQMQILAKRSQTISRHKIERRYEAAPENGLL